MLKIAAMGDNVVDCYLSLGRMFPGGNCLNVSVFARRFGAASAYIGPVGQDRAGDIIRRALEDEGVDVSRLRQIDGPTAYCVIGHRDADRIFLSSDLGVSLFEPSEQDLEFLRGFSAVHIGQSSGLDRHVADAARRTLVSYDFSTRRDPGHRRSVAPHCFLASVSGGDLEPQEQFAIGTELLELGATWVLVTCGRQGAMLANATDRFTVAAKPVEVVDTLGAGDTFIARTLCGLLAGEAPDRLLEAAADAAAETCGYFGAVGHGAPVEIAADPVRLNG